MAAAAVSTYETTADGVYIKTITKEDYEARLKKVFNKPHIKDLLISINPTDSSKYHFWVYDNVTKKVIDPRHNDTENWSSAKALRFIRDTVSVVTTTYIPLKKKAISRDMKKQIDLVKLMYDEDNVLCRVIKNNLLDAKKATLFNAVAKHKTNPERYELKCGVIRLKLENGYVWNITTFKDEKLYLENVFDRVIGRIRFKKGISKEDAEYVVSFLIGGTSNQNRMSDMLSIMGF